MALIENTKENEYSQIAKLMYESRIYLLAPANHRMKKDTKFLKFINSYTTIRQSHYVIRFSILLYTSEAHPIILYIQNECESSEKRIAQQETRIILFI